jgi:hypothetical protein
MNRFLPVMGLVMAVVLISGCTNTPGTEVDLTGKDYEALIALGVPIQCDVSSVAGFETDATVYIKGEQARAEASFEYDGTTYSSVSVIKDDKVYVQVVDDYFGELESDCDWIYISTDKDKEDASPSITADDLKDMDAADFTCVIGSFGDEKFATSGNACTMAEFLSSMMPDMGDVETDYCDYVTDPDAREQLGCE